MNTTDELLFVVDEENNPTAPKPREEVHELGLWHRSTHIWIINAEQQILCQKRSLLQDMNPDKWETFVDGHLTPNEEYIDNALRILQDELGISISKQSLNFFNVIKCFEENEFQAIYYIKWNGDISDLKLTEEEIDEVDWFDMDEIEKVFTGNEIDSWVVPCYGEDMLQFLENEVIKKLN